MSANESAIHREPKAPTINQLKELTHQAFAHRAYVSDFDGDAGVTGRFAFASYLGDGLWDVWLRNEADLAKGLGARKLTNIIDAISSLENAPTGPLQRLDGEAVYSAMPTETLLLAGPLLGIRRRKRATPGSFKKGATNDNQQ